MANVTLVNLNRVRVPPIGPYAIDIIGSALEDAGHEVSVLDLTPCDDPIAEIDNYFTSFNPDLVGLSLRNTGDLYFPSFLDLPNKGSFLEEHNRLIQRIKNYIPVDKIVIGGVGFSSNPQPLLKRFGLKYGIIGPGESIIIKIADFIDQKSSIKQLNPNNGILFDGRKNKILGKVKRKFYDNKWYYEYGGLGSIRTTNGCGMLCGYCVEPLAKGRGYNKRELDNVIDEIDQLVDMGIYDIHTTDSEFNMPFPHSKEVLRAIAKRGYSSKVKFWTYCQPSPFDEEYASLLAKANFVGINFGTDHTDTQVLKSMGKWFTKDHIKNSNLLCNDYGIAVTHDFLFGYPGDTPEKMFEAIDFVKKLDPWTMGVVVGLAVLPGTKLGAEYTNKLSLNQSLDGYYIPKEPLVDPTYFVDPSFEIPQIFNEVKDYIGEDIDRIMIPQVSSTSGENNQLVGCERIKQDLEKGKKGAYWYHYRSSQSITKPVQMKVPVEIS